MAGPVTAGRPADHDHRRGCRSPTRSPPATPRTRSPPGIAAAVNATTVPDPYSGLPLNGLVVAVERRSRGDLHRRGRRGSVHAGVLAGAGPSRQPTRPGRRYPASCTASITGTSRARRRPGDDHQLGSRLLYRRAGRYQPAAAGHEHRRRDQRRGRLDPATSLPLSSEVRASAGGLYITITAVDPSTPVTLACPVTTGSVEVHRRRAVPRDGDRRRDRHHPGGYDVDHHDQRAAGGLHGGAERYRGQHRDGDRDHDQHAPTWPIRSRAFCSIPWSAPRPPSAAALTSPRAWSPSPPGA